jgi:hypothetical protein
MRVDWDLKPMNPFGESGLKAILATQEKLCFSLNFVLYTIFAEYHENHRSWITTSNFV